MNLANSASRLHRENTNAATPVPDMESEIDLYNQSETIYGVYFSKGTFGFIVFKFHIIFF